MFIIVLNLFSIALFYFGRILNIQLISFNERVYFLLIFINFIFDGLITDDRY